MKPTSGSGLAEIAVPIAPRRHQHDRLVETGSLRSGSHMPFARTPGTRTDRSRSKPSLGSVLPKRRTIVRIHLNEDSLQEGRWRLNGLSHISFLIRTILEIQQIRSALPVWPSFPLLVFPRMRLSIRRLTTGVLSVLTTHRACCYSGAK